MLKESIKKLMRREDLDVITCQQVANEILEPKTNPLQIAAFLVLLRAKLETTEELIAILSAIRKKMIPVITQHKVLDLVGTGGDGANTINISTGSAILAASCGVKIAKHGNRAVSSLAGAADVLEALGVKIDLSPEKVSDCIDKVGIGFCFFPNFHPAARELRLLGKQLKIPTLLNFIGTLLNPASVSHYLIGVFDEAFLEIIANVLKETGTKRSIVVHGCGLDEISCVGLTKIVEVTQTEIKSSIIDPAEFGLPYCSKEDLRGGDATMNAQLLMDTFSGKNSQKINIIANTLILNAAVALYIYGIHNTISAGIPHARENLYNGSALKILNDWKECSHA